MTHQLFLISDRNWLLLRETASESRTVKSRDAKMSSISVLARSSITLKCKMNTLHNTTGKQQYPFMKHTALENKYYIQGPVSWSDKSCHNR